MDVLFESDLAFTGGRDGSIYSNRIVKPQFERVFEEPRKQLITSLKFDEANNYLWYGTPEQDVNCLKYLADVNSLDAEPYFQESNQPLVKPYMCIGGRCNYHCLLTTNLRKACPRSLSTISSRTSATSSRTPTTPLSPRNSGPSTQARPFRVGPSKRAMKLSRLSSPVNMTLEGSTSKERSLR